MRAVLPAARQRLLRATASGTHLGWRKAVAFRRLWRGPPVPTSCRTTTVPLLRSPHPAPQGKDWNGQLKYGTSNFYGANYFQSVTPQLSLGGEVFYLAEQRRRWAQPSATAGHWCRWCRCCCSWSALCCSVGAGLKPAQVAPGLPCAAWAPARASGPGLPAACVATEATSLPAPLAAAAALALQRGMLARSTLPRRRWPTRVWSA